MQFISVHSDDEPFRIKSSAEKFIDGLRSEQLVMTDNHSKAYESFKFIHG